VTDEREAHLTALLERIKDQFEVVGEGHAALTDTLQTMSRKQDELTAKVDQLAGSTSMINLRVGKIETDIGVLRSKVVKVEEDVHLIKDHLGLNGTPKKPPKRRPARKR
jgi:hypothetical protein